VVPVAQIVFRGFDVFNMAIAIGDKRFYGTLV
jgi:hypothetical protein